MTFPVCVSCQGSTNTGTSSPVLNVTASAGQLVVVYGCNYVSTGTARNFVVAGSGGSSWTALKGTSISTQFADGLWYSTTHTGGNITFSWSAGVGQGSMLAWVFTGFNISTPIELGFGSSGTGTSVTWPNFTPSSPGGSQDYYWGAICGNPRGAASEPFSSNYGLNNTFSYGSNTFSSTSVSATGAGAQATGSSRQPNGVTWSGINLAGWITDNFVIYPAGAAGIIVPNRSIIIP